MNAYAGLLTPSLILELDAIRVEPDRQRFDGLSGNPVERARSVPLPPQHACDRMAILVAFVAVAMRYAWQDETTGRWRDVPASVPIRLTDSADNVADKLIAARGDVGHAEMEVRCTNLTLHLPCDGTAPCIHYDAAAFDEISVKRFAGNIGAMLNSLGRDRDAPLATLAMLTEAERDELVRWQDRPADLPDGRCIHDLVADRARLTPDAVALVDDAGTMTYGALDRCSGDVARQLRERGVGAGMRVGLCVGRSMAMVVGLLGVMKAGAAYVPLDPSYPVATLASLIADCAPAAVLAHGPSLPIIEPLVSACSVLDLDTLSAAAATIALPPVDDENPAYVIYTSGSTGFPKGVINSHRGVVNKLLWMQEHFALTHCDAVLQKTSFTFDVSVWEIFWPLLAGARLVLARPEGHKDPAYLIEIIARHGVTIVHFVPSMLKAFLEVARPEDAGKLRHVMCSGEELTTGLVRQFRHRFTQLPLHNQYGPTEAAIEVTLWTLAPEHPVPTAIPIGATIPNTRILLLDDRGSRVPVGALGQIHIGGVAVATGYLGRADLTEAAFVLNPYIPGEKLYRTGDIGRYLPDGTLLFLGRRDAQMKVRGFRIEPREIETCLETHPAIRAAHVDAARDAHGDASLVAYFVGDVAAPTLRDHVAASLPAHMVPSRFVRLDAIPLTASGKIDRKALPALETTPQPEDGAPVDTDPVRQRIATIWRELLKCEHIGIDDDFFEVGGHSLSAMRLIARLRQEFGVDLAIRHIFEQPTIRELAVRIG